jgi:hypothetical protein
MRDLSAQQRCFPALRQRRKQSTRLCQPLLTRDGVLFECESSSPMRLRAPKQKPCYREKAEAGYHAETRFMVSANAEGKTASSWRNEASQRCLGGIRRSGKSGRKALKEGGFEHESPHLSFRSWMRNTNASVMSGRKRCYKATIFSVSHAVSHSEDQRGLRIRYAPVPPAVSFLFDEGNSRRFAPCRQRSDGF